jgi:hypothetical protein
VSDRDQLVQTLVEQGAGQGDSIHSWRCSHPDRYGKCECTEQLADAIIEAGWRLT